jgi:5-methylcytosine-specific restriction enzyme A
MLYFTREGVQSNIDCSVDWRPSSEGLNIMGVRGQPTKWDKWYCTARWARIRKHQLLEHPLCKYCLERGLVAPAVICDHVEPHRGDVNRFWLGPFQSLCRGCHDSAKRFFELNGFRSDSAWMDGLWTRATRQTGSADPHHPLSQAIAGRRRSLCRRVRQVHATAQTTARYRR